MVSAVSLSADQPANQHTSYHGEDMHDLPGFEGSEKRLEVDFFPLAADGVINTLDFEKLRFVPLLDPLSGLRRLTRAQLDKVCSLAECEIVSNKSCEAFDAYVLSESSMFVFPNKFAIKTCGTTKLLQCADHLLACAKTLGLGPCRVKFSRASYKFPESQPAPHQTFEQEVEVLVRSFGKLVGEGSAHVLGDPRNGLQWHVWMAQRETPDPVQLKRATLEVCMTELCTARASLFSQGTAISAKECTNSTGIRKLLPCTDIDDFVFDPCGYSMNGLEGEGFSTIHVTPEDGFSYASVELSGYKQMDIPGLVAQIAKIFQPGQMVVALSLDRGAVVDRALDVCKYSSGEQLALPEDLDLQHDGGVSLQVMPDGGCVSFHRLRTPGSLLAAKDCIKAGAQATPHHVAVKAIQGTNGLDDDERKGSETPPPYSPEGFATTEDTTTDEEEDTVRADHAAKKLRTLPPAPVISEAVQAVATRFKAQKLAVGRAALNTFLCETTATTEEDCFYVVDLGVVLKRYEVWRSTMPRVEPFYAVKCFGDPALLATLAAAGCNFDCASPAEMEAVLRMGVGPERIIYANACKPPKHIAFAKAHGVRVMTYDNEAELVKIAKYFPEAELVLRLRADDPAARCPLGDKYGAEEYEIEPLLTAAKAASLRVIGISFHVGSGAKDPNSFSLAVAVARQAFDTAERLGMQKMTLLDIGGGFSGGIGGALDGDEEDGVVMERVAASINQSLEKYFPVDDGVRVISEPGRYFAEASATLCASVFGRRIRPREQTGNEADTHAYWISDGLYGSFNCLLYDHATAIVRPLDPKEGHPRFPSTLFGPTCDGLDTVLRGAQLPILELGDWVVFDSMGAYTKSAGGDFNGFSVSGIKTYYTFCR